MRPSRSKSRPRPNAAPAPDSEAAPIDPQRPTPELLIWAYSHGFFPMADTTARGHPIEWYCPDPRGILPLDDFHVPKSLARIVRAAKFHIRVDTAFEQVLRACAGARNAVNRSWMNDRLAAAYLGLHEHGHAHSVEAWLNDELVGGLYGVQLGGAFFGESMFSRRQQSGANASKVCLVHLVERLRARGFTLLDTQFVNPHLQQFGCRAIPADEYFHRLEAALHLPVTW
jgi:leucyl/phenylalanyl-tRNA---protein transferase